MPFRIIGRPTDASSTQPEAAQPEHAASETQQDHHEQDFARDPLQNAPSNDPSAGRKPHKPFLQEESSSKAAVSPARTGSNWDEDGNYKIGKGKPPIESRFKPNQSGNPRGPKKGSKSFKTQAKEIFGITVPVKIGGKTKQRDALGVGLVKLYEKIAAGDLQSILNVIKIHRELYPDERAEVVAELGPEEQQQIDEILRAAGYAAEPVVREKRLAAKKDTEDTEDPEEPE